MDRIPPIQNQKLESLKIFQKSFILGTHFLGPMLKSKLTDKHLAHIACHHISHAYNQNCLKSAILLFLGSFRKCLNVYASLYILSAVLRGKSFKYFWTKLPYEITRSSVFLAANCFYFLGFFCLARKVFGGISYWGSLLANLPACFLSIIIERKQRRGLLALYLTNLASETAFKMLVSRKIVSPIPNGEVLLFALASAIYALLFKMRALDGSISNLIKMLVGSSESTETDHSVHKRKQERQSRVVKYYGVMTLLSCALKWLTNKNDKLHGLIAGFFSGWSMIFYKSSSIALYLNFKLLEILWMLGVKSNKLPLFKSFDVILYTLSTAFVLWVGLYEPHNIRDAYWRFLVKISDNRFAEVNRHILDEFGLGSSNIDKFKLKKN